MPLQPVMFSITTKLAVEKLGQFVRPSYAPSIDDELGIRKLGPFRLPVCKMREHHASISNGYKTDLERMIVETAHARLTLVFRRQPLNR